MNDSEDINSEQSSLTVTDSQDTAVENACRPIRSFVRRQGRMTESQKKAIDDHWAKYSLELKSGLLNPEEIFERTAPTIIEIGFGNGHSLAEMAKKAPEKNFVGIEVHRPGVGSLLIEAREKALSNIRFYCDDAVDVLEHCCGPKSIDGVQLFFPDPWHKRRHHKRRIVKHSFVDLISAKLKPGGYFHMATDWEEYSKYMMDVMLERDDFRNQAGQNNYSPRPDYRPITKFEMRGERLGHGVWDLVFVKK